MDDVTALIARARLSIDIAHARLIAARRAEWQGIHGERYRGQLSDAAWRVTALSGTLQEATSAPAWQAAP
ncbi:hypothetical protein [Demequina mangrovi]|uniref:Uncharacterized protein n=1 Tax=Demequina mangrovi TaxID=1043493 RepID=A0A1H7A093_9MICO|nr:hypothetical protein [Demequina mangrovi]SEJ59109.1 hypothetical protein SAMN05421637_2331 [Demequina mangrovi]